MEGSINKLDKIVLLFGSTPKRNFFVFFFQFYYYSFGSQ